MTARSSVSAMPGKTASFEKIASDGMRRQTVCQISCAIRKRDGKRRKGGWNASAGRGPTVSCFGRIGGLAVRAALNSARRPIGDLLSRGLWTAAGYLLVGTKLRWANGMWYRPLSAA